MTILDILAIYWLLPSLIVLFFIIQVEKDESGLPLDEFKSKEWGFILLTSLIWPLGLIGILFYIIVIKKVLVKPIRKLK